MDEGPEKPSTKQKILESAISLFAQKGYTETTIRELAAAVGVKEASIYNHFPSKSAILDYILDEYAQISYDYFIQEKLVELKENPTADGILACMRLFFPEDKSEYYLKELYVIFQEQHRNPTVRDFVTEKIIYSTEQVVRTIIEKLMEFGILRPNTNPDFWIKAHSSIIYTFSSRALLGIGDSSPDYSGMGMFELLWHLYDMMLKTCTAKDESLN
ncbi:MAG: TetR/AcrR family transcriptional regulator [Treponema sp.]|nr:TetR/AcrR family transcriptional regulator [Treponema sp.]